MLIAVVSVKGSPGVTTLCLALAARWPAPARPLVVEADPSGGDLATRYCLPPTPGLVSLAAAARRTIEPDLVWRHTQTLPGGLPVVAAPPDADRARAALAALTGERTGPPAVFRGAADQPGAVVLADCGRMDAGSPAWPLVRVADVMVLVSGSHADDLAHLAGRVGAIGQWSRCPVLLLAGSGYSIAEVDRELGVTPLARIPHDRRGAAVLAGRPAGWAPRRTGPSRSVLGRFASKLAAVLATPPREQPSTPFRRRGSVSVGRPAVASPTAAVPPPLSGAPQRGLRAVGSLAQPGPSSPGDPHGGNEGGGNGTPGRAS